MAGQYKFNCFTQVSVRSTAQWQVSISSTAFKQASEKKHRGVWAASTAVGANGPPPIVVTALPKYFTHSQTRLLQRAAWQ